MKLLPLCATLAFLSPHAHGLGFANGVKIGELTPNSVVIWVRTTENDAALNAVDQWTKDKPNWVVPGEEAKVEVRLTKTGPDNLSSKIEPMALGQTGPEDDYCLQKRLDDLEPATTYQLNLTAVSTASPDTSETATIEVLFTTPPLAKVSAPITFTVSTCQEFGLRDDVEKGHKIYSSMLKLDPAFFIQTGDTVYYDRKQPLSKTVDLARYRWHRMYSLPFQREFHNRIPSYWMHDDHDLLKDDCQPGDTYGELTWEDGIKIWEEQVPWSEKPYRTFRWGKDLQIWLPEVRYYRSPKKMEDGPFKSILGKEQWAWLEESMKASDATFKLYVSPTPVVGPDRNSKKDNHANKTFAFEGERLRRLLSHTPGTFVINGDRHWQYHSIVSETGLQEFGAGPASDAHAQGWNPNDKRPEHQFLRVKGGFLSVQVDGNVLTITHHDVDGKVTNETKLTSPPQEQ
ncbi:alkaline phosphatase D family protein [Roseibacillus persicicus]|uniref:Alkaline phosphatase n=1 Tax=Roseibacillus persicicus TaxID=454148 RepID=A0A918WGL4_9BACT|nr:alkaline phosphatase D family protein [Roseibacillus persicicus]GHC49409.1 alkaline phosphatase [Roseibacillus persicicus]